jgi:ectoine hydroxylase-related dioxygenase (phytanoyl-CoA dioxygenase family)
MATISILLLWVMAILPVGSSFLQHSSVDLVKVVGSPPSRWQHSVLQAQNSKRKENINDVLSSIGVKPVQHEKSKGSPEKRSKNTTKSSSTSRPKGSGYSNSNDVSLTSQLDYARNGHAVLRNFIDPSILHDVRKQVIDLVKEEELKAWKQKVQVASNSVELAAACKTVEECQHQLGTLGITEVPFLQYFNTWTSLPNVKKLAYDLGEAASILLDVPTVRLYQDSIFWKRSVDGPTPWHVDARMAPFDTCHFITFWIPLNDIPSSGTALMFCSKSHSDFALPYWNPLQNDTAKDQLSAGEWDRLEQRYPNKDVDYMPMKMGDLTVHSGWTLHCANENDKSVDRIALAISFVDAKAEIRPDALDKVGKGDNEDLNSYRKWVKSVRPRTQFQHDLVPIVWPR